MLGVECIEPGREQREIGQSCRQLSELDSRRPTNDSASTRTSLWSRGARSNSHDSGRLPEGDVMNVQT